MANPTVTLDASPFTDSGYIHLTWTNANKGANWYSWRVYRRDNPSGGWTLLKEFTADVASYTFDDYTAKSNVAQDWIVVRTYLSGSTPTEEARTPVYAATPFSDHYWLVHPYDPSQVYKLWQVTSDNFSAEAEVAEFDVIGRGRKIDQGTYWGLKGGLSCQLRDKTTQTARSQLNNLKATQSSKTWYWLRNPFGDIFQVVVSGLQVDRVVGTGLSEFTDVSFDYAEIVPTTAAGAGGSSTGTPFVTPTFTSFDITGVTTPREVGASFGPAVTFTWATTQPANIQPNSISILDITLGTTLESGTANDGTHAETLPAAVTRTTPGTHIFRIQLLDTQSGSQTRDLTVTWAWKVHYGSNSSPTLDSAAIVNLNGSPAILANTYARTYAMPAGGYKFICLADQAGGQINSVKDANTNFAVPMRETGTQDAGGFWYDLVLVTNAQGVQTNVRVYRTLNVLGGSINLAVT